MKPRNLLTMGLALSALLGCGGGGGEAAVQPPAPPPPVNNALQASDLSIWTNESEAVSDTLPATDADDDPLTFTIGTAPQKGNTGSGSFTYTPNPGETDSDEFTFTAPDGTDSSGPGTVSISINGIPTATDIWFCR